MTEAQEPTVTETTQATPTPAFHQEQVKKPRTPAQMAALEAARQKAFALRAEKKKEKVQTAEIDKPVDPEPIPVEEPREEVEYVKKGKAKPKAKKRIVVVEESSSEDEIEIRLPKRKNAPTDERNAPKADDRQLKLESSMKKMFSL